VLDNRTDFVTAAAVTPDGRRVLVAEDDSGITLWDADQGTIRSVLEGHTDHIQQLLVMADGRRAISVSGDTLGILPGVIADRSLRVWDLGQGTQIASFTAEGLITSVDMMPDGRTLIAGDAAGRVHFLLLEGITFTTARSS
jgi:WD40 repeat protein